MDGYEHRMLVTRLTRDDNMKKKKKKKKQKK